MKITRFFVKCVVSFLIMSMLISNFGMGTQIGNIANGNAATASNDSEAPSFSDTNGHWAEKQISEWAAKNWVQGYVDGSFEPDALVSRGEFMAFINRSFGFHEQASISFSDVTASDWVSDEVAKAVQAGYITGYEDGTVRAERPISRQEAAVIVGRLLKLDEKADRQAADGFNDAAQIAEWSQGAVGAVAEKGLMAGYGDRSFKPNSFITRAEVVVSRLLHFPVKHIVLKNAGKRVYPARFDLTSNLSFRILIG